MECVILYRTRSKLYPYNVEAVRDWDNDGEDIITVFPNIDAAVAYASANELFQSGQVTYQIVELDEL